MFFLSLLAPGGQSEPASKHFELSDLFKLARITSPCFSPDGRFIIVTVIRADRKTNRWNREFVLIDVEKKKQQTLEFNREGVYEVRFSPCGKYLSFLATAASGVPGGQVHIMPFPHGEARCVTGAPGGVRGYAWSPDGKNIAYLAEDEKPGTPGDQKYVTAFEVGNNDYLAVSVPLPVHLWMVPVSGDEARRLTNGSYSIVSGPEWSPDGTSIVFTRTASPYPGDSGSRTTGIIRVPGGETGTVTPGRGLEEEPSFSPDGSLLSYLYPREGNPAAVSDVYTVPAAGGGEPRNMTINLDINVRSEHWMPGGKSLLVSAPKGTRTGMWVIPLHGKAVRLDPGEIKAIYGVAVSAKGTIALVGSESYRPPELYFLSSWKSKPVRLTDFNKLPEGIRLGKTETIQWQGEDGMKADGIVTYPPDFPGGGAPGHSYPLVLSIHGGPTAYSNEAFDSFVQVTAARGWVVLQPNYRGSVHRGNEFQAAIMNDAAEGPGRDIMAGVETLIKRGFVDKTRIGVGGWSYGGFMTAWLIGRYPDVWRVAVAGAAPVDITDMTCLSMMNVEIRHAITSSPWTGDNFQAYFDQSPIKYLSKIRTPTLIMSKTGDTVVTVTGSYKLYHALKANGVPVRFIAYPGRGHFPGDPANMEDVYKRWLDWLSMYL